MRTAIAGGMSVLPIPEERREGIATLVLQTLAGAFVDYFADPKLDTFEQRLKVIRKMLALMVESELERAAAEAS
jgi:hypothetical protein